MKISVIIPTYKPDEYICECLNSYKNQTFCKDDFEIIIVLNGCNEPWQSYLRQFISNELKDVHITLIQTDAPGVSNARNIGLEKARGEYIAFMDDDDYVSPDYLQELYKYADRNTVSLSDAISFDDQTRTYDSNYGQHQTFLKLKGQNNISLFAARKLFNGPVMKLIHRDILNNRKFEESFANGEDSLFMFLISDKIKQIKFTSPKAVYYRRFRNNSATTRKRGRKEVADNCLRMCLYYTKYYFSNLVQYNLLFLLSRYAGALKTVLLGR